ncbi:helix-turn-helix domain-containing protein [Kribbella sp. NPDC003557]|uniref:helix-turn-helix domain-containing protein n=1 Tax=Kribbella sp. NPDC003557 TaxID=3154449 RepID=UPI0033B8EBE1
MSIAEDSITTAAPLLLTVEQAAQQLGIGRTTVFALLKSGELESVPLGRLRRIPAECITEYIDRLRAAARDGRQAA